MTDQNVNFSISDLQSLLSNTVNDAVQTAVNPLNSHISSLSEKLDDQAKKLDNQSKEISGLKQDVARVEKKIDCMFAFMFTGSYNLVQACGFNISIDYIYEYMKTMIDGFIDVNEDRVNQDGLGKIINDDTQELLQELMKDHKTEEYILEQIEKRVSFECAVQLLDWKEAGFPRIHSQKTRSILNLLPKKSKNLNSAWHILIRDFNQFWSTVYQGNIRSSRCINNPKLRKARKLALLQFVAHRMFEDSRCDSTEKTDETTLLQKGWKRVKSWLKADNFQRLALKLDSYINYSAQV